MAFDYGDKMLQRVTEGLIIAIPLAGGTGWRPAKILFCSKRYRNVILIGMGHSIASAPEEIRDLGQEIFNLKCVYTGSQIVRSGHWPLVGEASLLKSEEEASLRIVAGSVWLRDEELRQVSDQDRKSLPTMSVAGKALVEKWARE